MPRTRIRPIAHDDRLPLVEHLDELRARIVVSLLVFGAALSLCFWQNHLILEVVNRPLHSVGPALPPGFKPITLGVVEQFSTTFTVSAYFALLIALPVLLYQAYAFVVPAFTPRERRVALPLLLLVPVLFIGGVVFCYFVVLEPALQFLLNFNADEFTTQLRARDYYGFVTLTMISMGLLFQVPVGVLALTRLGVITPQGLRRNRRYALIVIAIVAALLPTLDPVTLLLEMVPLVVLYELSIWLSHAVGRPPADVADRMASAEGGS